MFVGVVMQFELRDTGLFHLRANEMRKLSDPIRVLSRVRSDDRVRSNGVLCEWLNLDGCSIQEVFLMKILNGSQSMLIRERLLDSGFWIEPGIDTWKLIQQYLVQESRKASTATLVERTGWYREVFVTPSWISGRCDEPYQYLSPRITPNFQQQGSLEDWQQEVGRFCRGNPYLIFSIGCALAAPLLKPAGLENGGIHIVSNSADGKTATIQVCASVCGAPDFMKSWIGTANGIAAVASEHNDLVLPLDEIGMAKAEDIDTCLYQIFNGAGKLRADKTGKLAESEHWRVLVLSTGEKWLAEIFESLGRSPMAGQEVRLIELPVIGLHGVLNDLHSFSTPQKAIDHLKSASARTYGSLLRSFMELITTDVEDLNQYVPKELQRIVDSWLLPNSSSQVQRVTRRFAVILVALQLASRNFLVNWSELESEQAVYSLYRIWLGSRGHLMNLEEYRLLQKIGGVLAKWEKRLAKEGDVSRPTSIGYRRFIDGEELWLIHKDEFLKGLNLPTHYMRDVELLFRRQCLESNERSRGTYKLKMNGRYYRFFALWPDRVRQAMLKMEQVDDE
ncbi:MULTISPECIES: DUF927 domain-containing protein [Enterobacterales]|uniref:DUF927 domain-containing protein n=2 Tax=Pseudomonadota TaxID=1224 RepID=UPI00351D1B04